MIGAAGQVSGYLAFGTSMDYMYEELKVPYPITIEVWGENGEGKRPKKTGMLRGGGGSGVGWRRRRQERRRGLLLMREGGDEEDGPRFEKEEVEEVGVFGGGGSVVVTSEDDAQEGRVVHGRGLKFSHSADRCIRMFNPAQDHEYRGVIANWVNAILLFTDHLVKNYHVDPPSPPPATVAPAYVRDTERIFLRRRHGRGDGAGEGR